MPFVIYSVLRLLLLVATAIALYLLGMRGWLLAVLAIVIAAMLSFLLLRSYASATAEYFAGRRAAKKRTVDRMDRMISDDAAAEDEFVDAAGSPAEAGGHAPPEASRPEPGSEQEPRAEQ